MVNSGILNRARLLSTSGLFVLGVYASRASGEGAVDPWRMLVAKTDHQSIPAAAGQDNRMGSIPALGVHLAGVLTNAVAAVLPNDHFRQYVGSVSSVMTLCNRPDTNNRAILYQIGRHTVMPAAVAGEQLPAAATWVKTAPRPELSVRMDVDLPDSIAGELAALSRKHTNFSASFKTADLCGLGYTLAAAVATFSVNQRLTTADIRCGQPLRVRVLSVADDPIAASDASVFIPRSAESRYLQGSFAALVAAANSYGTLVYTDVVATNAAGAAIITEPAGAALAVGCVNALRILLSMYNVAGHGDVMAYAITKGIHSVLTVVGHSDEGGYMRDVTRALEYANPFGGVYCAFAEDFVGLPVPDVRNPGLITTLVDAIALKTAGLVALCAPLAVVNGKKFPMVYVSDQAPRVHDGGVDSPAGDNWGESIAGQLAADMALFSGQYAAALAEVFGVSCSTGNTVRMLDAQAGSIVRQANNRHLRFAACAPWFWIEPTSLFGTRLDTEAENAGYGLYATTMDKSEYPCFEGLTKLTENTNFGEYAILHRSARTNKLYAHLLWHNRDGLANIIPSQFVSSSTLFKGGTTTVAAARTAFSGLDEYMWGRGQSTLPHPAEFMYTGNVMGVRVSHTVYDINLNQMTACHVPTPDELAGGTVVFSASRPIFINQAVMANHPTVVLRGRTVAALALMSARAHMLRGLAPASMLMLDCDVEPVLRDVDRVTINQASTYGLSQVTDLLPPRVVVSRGPLTAIYHDRTANLPGQAGAQGIVRASSSRDGPGISHQRDSTQTADSVVKEMASAIDSWNASQGHEPASAIVTTGSPGL